MKHSKWRQAQLKWAAISTVQLLLLLFWVSTCATSSIQTTDRQNNTTNSSAPTSVALPATNSSGAPRQQQNLQLISNWLELVSANRRRNESPARTEFGTGVALEVSPPSINSLFQYQPTSSSSPPSPSWRPSRSDEAPPNSRQVLVATASRSARTTKPVSSQDEFPPVDVFVSNVCERDFMLIQVRTSRPFYGVIHTLNHRRVPECAIEGDGTSDFQLNISHVLDSRDPHYCGVIKLTRVSGRGQSLDDQQDGGELLSVVLAIRTRRNIELPDDKLLVLNCTNRCRQPDCSSSSSSGRLASIRSSQEQAVGGESPVKQRQVERESEADIRPASNQQQDPRSWWARAAKRAGDRQRLIDGKLQPGDTTCSVWQFPWLLAALVCLAVLLAGCAISNCIICRLRSSALSSPRGAASESQSDMETTRSGREAHQAKQHTIYYDNENRRQRSYSPVDVGRGKRSRPRQQLERLPDRLSR